MLQKQISIVVLFSIISACVTTVPSFRPTKATELLPMVFTLVSVPFDASGDIMAVPLHSWDPNSNNGSISIRRRGPDGIYNEVFQLYENAHPFINDKWIAEILYNEADDHYFLKIYELDGTNTLTNPVSLTIVTPRSIRFFPGNVFVAESADLPRTLEIYSYADSWAYNGSVDLNNHTVMALYSLSGDGKFVVTSNNTFIDVWQFQNNPPTFNRIESLAYDSRYKTVGLYNGVDTVVVTSYTLPDNGVYGAFLVYTKTNGEWAMTQNVTAYQLGLRPAGFLGITGLFVDENTFVLSALLENSDLSISKPGGRCVVMSRGIDGMWTQSMQLEMDPNDNIIFGSNFVLNNDHNELLIPGLIANSPQNYSGFIYSTCLLAPINVTCNNISTTDCANIDPTSLNLDMTSLYTINSSPACGDVNTTVVNSTITDNQVKVELSFTKIASSTSCTSTVTCLTAPIAAPTKAPARKTSSASLIKFTGALFLTVALAFCF